MCLKNIIQVIKTRRMRRAGYVARMAERRGAYRFFVGKSEETRPLGRPRRRWEDNIKMAVHAVGWRGMDWIDLAQKRDRLRAGTCECGNEHSGSRTFGQFLE